eukprot:s2731_g12.t6
MPDHQLVLEMVAQEAKWEVLEQPVHPYRHHPLYQQVLVRLRDDPVGIAFPMANWSAGHALSKDRGNVQVLDTELLQRLNLEANELPWRGNGKGRSFKSLSYLDEAFEEVCQKAPLRLRQGDALLYYHLHEHGQVNLRSMHASCTTETSDEAKIFMAKFVRGGSLLGTYGSLRTPPLPAEMRAWMDQQQVDSGLNAAALWISGEDIGVLDPSRCGELGMSQYPWFVRPAESGSTPELLCGVPPDQEFRKRQPGEVFEIHIMIGNTGSRPWPAQTVLSLRDGDPMGGPAGLRLQEVPPGSTVPLSLQLQAPESGKAFSVWSLADENRVPFGALIWVDADVEGPNLASENKENATLSFSTADESDEALRGLPSEADVVRPSAQFWSDSLYQELSSQDQALPVVGSPDRGQPRLCWTLGHRFWFGELSFHHVAPPETFVFGFCTPESCRETNEVDAQVAKPFLRRLFASSSGSDWCRLELKEWTVDKAVIMQAAGVLLSFILYASLICWTKTSPGQEHGSVHCALEVQSPNLVILQAGRSLPCCLRLVATVALVVYHMARFPIYRKPGLPKGFAEFCTWSCGILHDPLFTALSVSLLLRGGPAVWTWQCLASRLLRKWLRLAPVGVASRLLLCSALRRIPTIPFLLKVQPRIDARLCTWSSEALRCTHHTCTPIWGFADLLLAFPPLDFAGNYVEQDMLRSALLTFLACSLVGDRLLSKSMGLLFLMTCLWYLARSLPACVVHGRVHGPCVPSPLILHLDLPGDNVVALAVLLWHTSRHYFPQVPNVFSTFTFAAVVAMEVAGSPSDVFMVSLLWYLCSRVLLGVAVAQLCEGRDDPDPGVIGRRPPRRTADRLCYGVCIVHVRVMEIIFGYLRPGLQDFSWDLFMMDVLVVLLFSFILATVVQLPSALCQGTIDAFRDWRRRSQNSEGRAETGKIKNMQRAPVSKSPESPESPILVRF